MNLKNLTYKKIKDGILNLSTEQQLKIKLTSTLWGNIGLILALITLIYQKLWGFSIFIFFMTIIQFVSYIGQRQQYIKIKEILSTSEQNQGGK